MFETTSTTAISYAYDSRIIYLSDLVDLAMTDAVCPMWSPGPFDDLLGTKSFC